MSGPDQQERAKELARLWQGTVVPMDDEGIEDARRERVLPRISEAIGRAAQQRQVHRFTRRVVFFLSVAATVVLAIGLAHLRGAPRRVNETETSAANSGGLGGVRATAGDVTLLRDARPELVKNSRLEMNDTLTTAVGSRAEVRLTDLVVADVSAVSEVSLVAPRASVHRLLLTRGRIDARVDDWPSTTPKLVVETPDVEVVVTGTVFHVDVTRPESSQSDGNELHPAVTTVGVTKGRIVVRRQGVDIASVSAGETWTSAIPEPTKPVASAAATEPQVHAAPSEREHRASATPLGGADALRDTRRGAPAETFGGTLAEENALYQAAIEARKQHNDYQAIAQLTELLARYPASPLAAESRVERMRALRRTGHAMEATRDAKRYLSDYPNGFARDEAQKLVTETEGP